jgi:hypothetical protein
MFVSRRDAWRAHHEHGGVLVMVAVWAPVLVLLVTLVIDVGNWFEHKRHAQLQADAGALSGGGLFAGCFSDPAAANAAISDEARRYAGDPTYAGAVNGQVGGANQGTVEVRINRNTYADGTGPDDTVEDEPCAAAMLDVKVTESTLPWFFRVANVGAINAHARVRLNQVDSLAGSLPLAVPDINPAAGSVSLVNQATGAVLTTQPLARTGTASGLAVWDNSAAPLNFTFPAGVTGIGVRIALSGSASTTTCGDLLVTCYDAGSPGGIDFVRAYSTAAYAGTPLVRDARLYNGTCTDPYFMRAGGCSVGIKAQLDAGAVPTTSLSVRALGGDCPANGRNAGCPLAYNATGPNAGFWTSSTMVGVPTAAGAVPIGLRWEQTTGSIAGLGTCSTANNNPCVGTVPSVQQAFVGSDARSGPIDVVQVWEGGSFWANSFAQGTTHELVVRIGIRGSLGLAASVGDPIVQLRVIKDGGSQTQSIDCDPDQPNLRDEITNGCGPAYTRNPGTPCPAYNVLWGTPQPWTCVKTSTGGSIGQARQGMDARILQGGTCAEHPNNWSSFPDFPPGDTRVVPMFVTPFGTFQGSGNDVLPVTDFAVFYITGWDGQGPACPGDDPVPGNGYVVGHFIKYFVSLPAGGTTTCNPSALAPCAPMMTD